MTSATLNNLPTLDVTGLKSLFPTKATSTISTKAALPAAATLRRTVKRRRMIKLEDVAATVRTIGALPDPHEVIHATMTGAFAAWHLVPAVLELSGCAIERLDVATLGYSRPNMQNLFSLMDSGQIGTTVFLVSTYFRSVDRSIYEDLHAGLQARGGAVYVRRTHAKILALSLADGREIVVESSSNLRSCRNLETFSMHQSADLAGFHREWMRQLIEETSDK